jgi:hypothetical protein
LTCRVCEAFRSWRGKRRRRLAHNGHQVPYCYTATDAARNEHGGHGRGLRIAVAASDAASYTVALIAAAAAAVTGVLAPGTTNVALTAAATAATAVNDGDMI